MNNSLTTHICVHTTFAEGVLSYLLAKERQDVGGLGVGESQHQPDETPFCPSNMFEVFIQRDTGVGSAACFAYLIPERLLPLWPVVLLRIFM